MSRVLQYPSVMSLEKAGVCVSFTAQALRLMWRLELTPPTYEPGPKPRVVRVPASMKTEWRVWVSEPSTKEKDMRGWSPQEFSAMELFSDDHPFANKPLTEPPSGSLNIWIRDLEYYTQFRFPEAHKKCYDHKAQPPASFCSHGVPIAAQPPVLCISANPDRPFITIGDYVHQVRKLFETDSCAGDLYRAWSETDYLWDRPEVVDSYCSPVYGGLRVLQFAAKKGMRGDLLYQVKQYKSSLHHDDNVEAQNNARRDRRTAELMKRNPDYGGGMYKALARREEGLGFWNDWYYDDDVDPNLFNYMPPKKGFHRGHLVGPLSGSVSMLPGPAPLSSKWDYTNQPTGRYPSLSDLRHALRAAIPKPPKTADAVFSLAADQLRWTVQLERHSPGAGQMATLKYEIKMRNCVKPYDILPWNPSSNTASQPVVQPCVGSITIQIPELMVRESHCLNSHRKCFGEAPIPEQICLCGKKLYHAPQLTVEAAEGSDFVTVGDYVTSVTKWMEGEDVAGGMAEEWFPEGNRGCKRARVELLDPAYLFLGLYEEKGCDLTEEEDKATWMDTLVNHMKMAHDPWAEMSAHISEWLRGQSAAV